MSIINFKDDYELVQRVKTIIGIPEEMLKDTDIISPQYIGRAEKYIGSKIKDITEELKDYEKEDLKIAFAYYVAYLMSPSMPMRLPQRMENISTKTLLQTIDWEEFGQKMLSICDEVLDGILEEHGIEKALGNTFVDLSDAVPYPNELV